MPPVTRSPAADLLAALVVAFDRLHVRWYLFGAQAVIAYGAPRLTADADVTVELGRNSTHDLVAELQQHGFELRIPDVDDSVARTRVLPLIHSASGLPLDVVLAGPGPEEAFLARARRIPLGGVEVPIMAPEDLVAVKILAGRPQDLQDAVGVLRSQSDTLDRKLIRSTLGLLERALDRSDLLPELDRLLRQAE